MFWYILFVQTGCEHKVERLLKNRLNCEESMPFIPLLETIFKTSGSVKKELKPLFPSYVFIESEIPSIDFIKETRNIINASKDIIRFLNYGDINEIAVREYEKQMLLSLCNSYHCVESSSGIVEGDKIHIIDGPLKGLESTVKKIDRHKCQAWVEIEFMGSTRLVNMAIEIIKKIS